MMGHLECNERLSSWLQPLQGSVQDQIADNAILRQVVQERSCAMASEADFVEYMVGL